MDSNIYKDGLQHHSGMMAAAVLDDGRLSADDECQQALVAMVLGSPRVQSTAKPTL